VSIDLAALLGTLFALTGALLGFSADAGGFFIFVLVSAGVLLLSYPLDDIKRAFNSIFSVYRKTELNSAPVIAEIIQVATVARKEGVLAMEASQASIRDPLLKKAIKYVIDGFDAASVQAILGTEIQLAWETEEAAASVFVGMGNVAPWIGFFATVLVAAHVRWDAAKSAEELLGSLSSWALGLTVGYAIFLPWGLRLKRKAAQKRIMKNIVSQGILGIQEGLNPSFLLAKLSLYLSEAAQKAATKSLKKP
jgi:chemotaxis protein MotA